MKDLIKQWKKYKKEYMPMYFYNSETMEFRPLSGYELSFEDFMDWLAKTGRYKKDNP